ncbi:hypothetical protein [Streptomyces sp. AD55]|uniref:hypothetical protein n=1 Tax=Streptomyces sp. AD55 TaxID=3242895 RepID=UPI0035273CC9
MADRARRQRRPSGDRRLLRRVLPTLAPFGISPRAGRALLVLWHCPLTLIRLGGCVLASAKVRVFFEQPAVRRVMGRLPGVVLIGFGVKAAVSQF